MAHILIMPRQGNTVESCIIVDWKVKEGDVVTADTNICDVETDKAAFEIPAGAEGAVIKLLRDAGDDVPILEPIAVIGIPGENWQEALGTENREQEQDRDNIENVAVNAKMNSDIVHNVSPSSKLAISPRARNLAEKEAFAFGAIPGTGPEGRIIERDVKAALENAPALTAAAKAAGGGSIPLQGTGFAGRITAGDIAASHDVPYSTPHSAPILFGCGNPPSEIPVKGIRKVIADKMLQSLAETAQFTLNASAPVSRLQDIRSRIKTEEYKITVNDLILFAVSRVLPRFSYMNAHKNGNIIKTFEQVHLGLAVDTPRGLMVPVIRNANSLSLVQISAEVKRLAAACQNGTAKPEELSGSTFTVTNLGSLGITSFTPILNIPEVAILGVCSIELKPAGYPIQLEPYIGFSLTINHQVVDGAPAARFLKELCEAVANIDLLLGSFYV